MTAARNLPLQRLDAALRRAVLRLRARYQLSLDEFRGVYISDEQVDALLGRSGLAPQPGPELPPRQPHPGIDALQARFDLTETAIDLLLLALAPDIDPAYATLIAYLNDDVRRRWPCPALSRRLFGEGAELALQPAGPLFGPGLLLPRRDQEERCPFGLQEFAANPVLTSHLLGGAVPQRAGLAFAPAADTDAAGPLAALAGPIAAGLLVLAVLTGARRDDRSALAGQLAHRLHLPLLVATLVGEPAPTCLLRDAILAARLSGALLLLETDAASLAGAAPLLQAAPVSILVCPREADAWRLSLAGTPFVEIRVAPPNASERRQLWDQALAAAGLLADTESVEEVSDRFRLSARQIQAACASLRMGGAAVANCSDLLGAARLQAGAELDGLAQRVTPANVWADMVLPAATLRQLRQLAAAIRHRERVFATWGFGGGPGLAALFSGGPGTGKSMSAGVLAREAGLELWRVDLSSVVSKYIGETEKQLDRIFDLARDGNALLFFDEADALFGKRSEVKDAHDRYANIEVAFLLQRLETFDGVVILASNLARNVDQAFSRRMHFVIDFPLPDAALRERLWRAAIPERAPAAEIDYAFLAAQFAFAGGDIRVAALDAAFAAAADRTMIDMPCLLRAISRQLLKQGKVPTGSDFRQYRPLLELPATGRIAAE